MPWTAIANLGEVLNEEEWPSGNSKPAARGLGFTFPERTLKFIVVDLEEGDESLSIVYQGIPPDSFQDGREVVIEGHLNSAGVFKADSILTKCPSKYEPAA